MSKSLETSQSTVQRVESQQVQRTTTFTLSAASEVSGDKGSYHQQQYTPSCQHDNSEDLDLEPISDERIPKNGDRIDQLLHLRHKRTPVNGSLRKSYLEAENLLLSSKSITRMIEVETRDARRLYQKPTTSNKVSGKDTERDDESGRSSDNIENATSSSNRSTGESRGESKVKIAGESTLENTEEEAEDDTEEDRKDDTKDEIKGKSLELEKENIEGQSDARWQPTTWSNHGFKTPHEAYTNPNWRQKDEIPAKHPQLPWAKESWWSSDAGPAEPSTIPSKPSVIPKRIFPPKFLRQQHVSELKIGSIFMLPPESEKNKNIPENSTIESGAYGHPVVLLGHQDIKNSTIIYIATVSFFPTPFHPRPKNVLTNTKQNNLIKLNPQCTSCGGHDPSSIALRSGDQKILDEHIKIDLGIREYMGENRKGLFNKIEIPKDDEEKNFFTKKTYLRLIPLDIDYRALATVGWLNHRIERVHCDMMDRIMGALRGYHARMGTLEGMVMEILVEYERGDLDGVV